jgi:peptide deformylase
VGFDTDGNELSIEADELLARAFQHEIDHLDGVLFIERLDPDDRKAAMRIIREQRLQAQDLLDAEVAFPAGKGSGFSLR